MRRLVERLLLVRHPKPAVEPGTCYGSTDVGVDADDASALLGRLADTLPRGAPILASPLRRCADLARALAARGWPEPTFDARLAEMRFGDWEGRRWDDIPREQIDAWSADVARYAPPGGESVEALAARATAALRERIAAIEVDEVDEVDEGPVGCDAAAVAGSSDGAVAVVGRSAGAGSTLIVVTHAGVIQTVSRTLAGAPLAGFGATRVEYGQVVALRRAGDRFERDVPPG